MLLTQTDDLYKGVKDLLRNPRYINGNWESGGFPAWLRGVPGIEYRTDNAPFKREMGRWFRDFVEHIRPFLRPVRGGPVISVQVENEYTYSTAADNRYVR